MNLHLLSQQIHRLRIFPDGHDMTPFDMTKVTNKLRTIHSLLCNESTARLIGSASISLDTEPAQPISFFVGTRINVTTVALFRNNPVLSVLKMVT